ncbi:hypothetical protein LWF01_12870 [Saxibacter everestensis]|uniref:Lysyl-tRNA synthetase n=1 Tax=Saxibacter everestensis TaxID=2909229 RepID=A0ABY8QRX1_9MICO|nr:hypothetical protein LWF01_12870 [Brevibacteriaceae bacterium ZFBP1038]
MEYFAVLAPSAGVGLIFFWVMRSIMQADRRERAETDRFYAAQAADRASAPVSESPEQSARPGKSD